jgi:hypothetical protein
LVRDGQAISAIDLCMGNFVLMAGPDAEAWCEAAASAATVLGMVIECHQIGRDLLDDGAHFCERYGIDATGAVLVRPDGYVAWRSRRLPEGDCAAVLTDVMHRVLSLR